MNISLKMKKKRVFRNFLAKKNTGCECYHQNKSRRRIRRGASPSYSNARVQSKRIYKSEKTCFVIKIFQKGFRENFEKSKSFCLIFISQIVKNTFSKSGKKHCIRKSISQALRRSALSASPFSDFPCDYLQQSSNRNETFLC